jgi:hypothetical protein
MRYQWDPHKASANIRKHGIAFADAVFVFEDEAALTTADEDPDEERSATMGTDAFGQILVVVYTWRGDEIRIISARRATRTEARQYKG